MFTANQDKLVDVFAQDTGLFIEMPKIVVIPRVAPASSVDMLTKQGLLSRFLFLRQCLVNGLFTV